MEVSRAAMEKSYKAILEWDDETKVYVVTVPVLPGCVTQGNNRKEALERIQEAIEGHIEALSIIGEPVPNGDVEFAEVLVHVS
jgi:predicted RNase H-like HicB family nuclease